MNELTLRRNRLSDAPLWVHGLAWGSFIVVTLVCILLWFVYRDADIWGTWLGENASAAKWPTGTETFFNERISGRSIYRTPASTLSNLAYVFVGLYVLAYALYDHRRPTTASDPYVVRRPGVLAYFGLVCIFLGYGSGHMHASISGAGHWYDILGMYGSLVAILAVHWGRWMPDLPLGKIRLPAWPMLVIAACAVTYYIASNDARFGAVRIFAVLIGAIMASFGIAFALRWTRVQHRWYVLSGACFGIAYLIWNLANANRFTPPDSWFQGHAVWHLLTAFSLGFMATLYRSEVPVPRETAAT